MKRIYDGLLNQDLEKRIAFSRIQLNRNIYLNCVRNLK